VTLLAWLNSLDCGVLMGRSCSVRYITAGAQSDGFGVVLRAWRVDLAAGASLLRRLQFALEPARCRIRFQRVGAVAIHALHGALAFAAGRQCKDQEGPALGAIRSMSPAHAIILPPVLKAVNSS
jgi:hypothetical protein